MGRKPKPQKINWKEELPSRATRGNRMNRLLEEAADEFEEGDQEFWNQQFFKDEEADEVYHTEESKSDVFSSDFLDTEESSDEEQDSGEERPRRKKVKPPSYRRRRPPTKRAAAKRKAEGEAGDGGPPRARPRPPSRADQPQYEAPSLRHSTRTKVQEAATKREEAEKVKKVRRKPAADDYKPMTQAELLAEAAQTEIENLKSLETLIAREEETKAKAHAARAAYVGPLLRFKSSRREGGDGDRTVLELVNCVGPPPELQPRKAPPYPRPQRCIVTGGPARYRDPLSGLPYATPAAFRELRHRLAHNPHQRPSAGAKR